MRTLTDIFIEVPFSEQLRRIKYGLQCEVGSPERNYAKDALLCMFGPSTMSMIGSVLVAICAIFVQIDHVEKSPDTGYVITFVTPTTTELDKLVIDEDKVKEKVEDRKIDENLELDDIAKVGSESEIKIIAPPEVFSSNDANEKGEGVGGDLDTPIVPFAVAMTKSPVIISGLYANRTKGGIENATRIWGDGIGKRGSTEVAVLRSLRWLKKNQNADGSWNKTKPAMTGLALLTYLAHGETPASEEFGLTVEKAIKWLIDNQESDGRFKGRDKHDYSHPIATYALCEAYGMTKIPAIKVASEKAIDIIIKGQHSSGGWDYNCKVSDRDDTSYMGWCVQALKAAQIAELSNEGLGKCIKRAVFGFKANADSAGGFGYIGRGNGGLTGAGVLCMQLLGVSKEVECKNGVAWLNRNATFDWDKPWLGTSLYYWYYATQAKFHMGGDVWKEWNKQFAPQLVKNQQIERGAIMGPKGKMVDIGWWEGPKGHNAHSDGLVMDTCLCTLQLEVYYKCLPTFQPVIEKEVEGNDDIQITVANVSK